MGGGGPVGGNPARIDDGGTKLRTASRGVGQRSTGVNQAGTQGSGAAGDANLAGALSRFAAAAGGMTDGLTKQLDAAALLATNASKDLSTAGGH
jgi:hypothetical protein